MLISRANQALCRRSPLAILFPLLLLGVMLLTTSCGAAAVPTAVVAAASPTAASVPPTAAATASAPTPAVAAPAQPLRVVAAENFWGSIATQLGGNRVAVTSIISNPDTDPHDYEPTPADARTIASAHYVIMNGIGYDPWAPKLVAANPTSGRA